MHLWVWLFLLLGKQKKHCQTNRPACTFQTTAIQDLVQTWATLFFCLWFRCFYRRKTRWLWCVCLWCHCTVKHFLTAIDKSLNLNSQSHGCRQGVIEPSLQSNHLLPVVCVAEWYSWICFLQMFWIRQMFPKILCLLLVLQGSLHHVWLFYFVCKQGKSLCAMIYLQNRTPHDPHWIFPSIFLRNSYRCAELILSLWICRIHAPRVLHGKKCWLNQTEDMF